MLFRLEAPPITAELGRFERNASTWEADKSLPVHRVPPEDWPNLAALKAAQSELLTSAEKTAAKAVQDPATSLFVTPATATSPQRILIPAAAARLKTRIVAISHQASAGHRSQDATLREIRLHFTWPNLRAEVVERLRTCIQCLKTADGTVIPRPIGSNIQASRPGEILHLDYGSIGKAAVLVLVDGFSGFVSLSVHRKESATAATKQVLAWCGLLGLPDWVVSDTGSHFTSLMQKRVFAALNVKNIFSPALVPHVNGKVERMMRTLQAVLQAFISEHAGLTDADWPGVIPAVAYILNTTPRRRLGNVSPMQIITGYQPRRPVEGVFLKPGDKALVSRVIPYDFDFTEYVEAYLALLMADVETYANQVRERTVRRSKHKGQRNESALLPRINVGDFVLVRMRTQMGGGRKRSVQRHRGKAVVVWQGPLVVAAQKSPWLFVVVTMTMAPQNLAVTQESAEDVHVTRIRRFSDKHLNVTQELVDLARADAAATYIDEILDFKPKNLALRNWSQLKLKVSWLGFEPADSTWEPIEQLFEDARVIVKRFLKQGKGPNALLNHAFKQLMLTAPNARPSFVGGGDSDFEDEYLLGSDGDLDADAD
jgi:transposase InsO family protein